MDVINYGLKIDACMHACDGIMDPKLMHAWME
jgi:hypothetical protein